MQNLMLIGLADDSLKTGSCVTLHHPHCVLTHQELAEEYLLGSAAIGRRCLVSSATYTWVYERVERPAVQEVIC